MTEKDVTYSGAAYTKFRPSYSAEIYSLIYNFHNAHNGQFSLAIDDGTGTGQCAVELAKKFDQVYGIDGLPDQISNAIAKPNITYQVGKGEDLSAFKDHSVDLITVATAFHWFDHPRFFEEAKRVLKPLTGTLAVFSYYYPIIKNASEKANDTVKSLTVDQFLPYSNTNMKYIINMYRDIKFPFKEQKWYISPTSEDTTHISQPLNGSLMAIEMTIENLGLYLKTASPYLNLIKDEANKGKEDPVDKMIQDLMKEIGTADTSKVLQLEWPTVLVLAKND